MSLAEDIKDKAIELGFDLVGITRACPIDTEQVELLADWLKSGYAGRMTYMHRNFEKRIDPTKLLKNAQSVICLGLNYKPPKRSPSLPSYPYSHCERSEAISTPAVIASETCPELVEGAKQSHLHSETAPMGEVANYAQYEDYHLFIKKQLRKLVGAIRESPLPGTDAGYKFKICVDSAPLAERALAARAGLGFIGKNRMLINPEFGPQILLGEIITDLKLQPDEPISCHSKHPICHSERKEPSALSGVEGEESIQSTTTKCSNCNKCIDACPTGALRPDGQFDANKCISYLTTVRQAHRPEQGRRIEYKGQIPPDLAEKIGARLFGCDECVLACPYQESAPVCKNKQFKFYNDRGRLNLQEILNLGQADFEARFADSPIKRLSLDRLKRNARICLANITSRSC